MPRREHERAREARALRGRVGARARLPPRPVACSPPPRTARRRAAARDPPRAPDWRRGASSLRSPVTEMRSRRDAERGEALRVGVAASAHRAQAFEGAAQQRRQLLVARQAALRDAPRDDHHRNVTARRGRDPARPELRLDQHQRRRRNARRAPPRRTTGGRAARSSAARRAACARGRRGRSPCWWTPPPRARAARSASSSRVAARISPTLAPCTHTAPGACGPRRPSRSREAGAPGGFASSAAPATGASTSAASAATPCLTSAAAIDHLAARSSPRAAPRRPRRAAARTIARRDFWSAPAGPRSSSRQRARDALGPRLLLQELGHDRRAGDQVRQQHRRHPHHPPHDRDRERVRAARDDVRTAEQREFERRGAGLHERRIAPRSSPRGCVPRRPSRRAFATRSAASTSARRTEGATASTKTHPGSTRVQPRGDLELERQRRNAVRCVASPAAAARARCSGATPSVRAHRARSVCSRTARSRIDERMADEIDAQPAARVDPHLEREDHRHAVDAARDLRDASGAPRPDLRRHVVEDRHAGALRDAARAGGEDRANRPARRAPACARAQRALAGAARRGARAAARRAPRRRRRPRHRTVPRAISMPARSRSRAAETEAARVGTQRAQRHARASAACTSPDASPAETAASLIGVRRAAGIASTTRSAVRSARNRRAPRPAPARAACARRRRKSSSCASSASSGSKSDRLDVDLRRAVGPECARRSDHRRLLEEVDREVAVAPGRSGSCASASARRGSR